MAILADHLHYRRCSCRSRVGSGCLPSTGWILLGALVAQSLDDAEDNILKVDWVVSNYQIDFSLVIDNIKLKKLVDYCTN